ncbi:MAG: precorrin-3B C(17)-methyltransferase [Lachnospiraceae bacterium]|jgi:precorrin-3B C17-methyltransferase
MKDLYVVGLGPGRRDMMTQQAAEVLSGVDVIIGYITYIEIIRSFFPEKKFMATPMRQEIDRCRLALEEADKGENVAIVSGGDAGIYGMAGLIYELSPEHPEVQIHVIPGITAAVSGAALLGAPLMHDFCVISLSDLLTPWRQIESRLTAAANADFVIVLYNPASRRRSDYLKKACFLLMDCGLPDDRVCGMVSNIARAGESTHVCTLRELAETPADMFTTVFIGNSATRLIDGWMVTPRGYRILHDENRKED